MAENDLSILVKFLKRAENGEFAEVDRCSIKYSRLKEKTDYIEDIEDNYNYSIG